MLRGGGKRTRPGALFGVVAVVSVNSGASKTPSRGEA